MMSLAHLQIFVIIKRLLLVKYNGGLSQLFRGLPWPQLIFKLFCIVSFDHACSWLRDYSCCICAILESYLGYHTLLEVSLIHLFLYDRLISQLPVK
jgi:hypothetical protein